MSKAIGTGDFRRLAPSTDTAHVDGRGEEAVFLAADNTSGAGTEQVPEVRLNKYVAIASVLVLASTLYGINYLHSYQMVAIAKSLRSKASTLQQAGDHSQAYFSLRQYLSYVPQDTDAVIELARITGKLFRASRDERAAVSAYEKVLRTVKDRDLTEFRLELVEILLESGRNTTAIEHLKIIETSDPGNDQVQAKLGFCYEMEQNFEASSKAYQNAIRVRPGNFNHWFDLARIEAERLGRPGEALSLMDRLVSENRTTAEAYATRGQIRLLQGDLEGAILDGRTAYRLDPSSRDVLLLIVELLSIEANSYDTRALFDVSQVRRELEVKNPATKEEDISLALGLAKLDMAESKLGAAVERLKAAIDKYPERGDLLWLLVDLLTIEKRTEEARQTLARFSDRRFRPYVADYLLARIEMSEHRWIVAARILEKLDAVEEKPSFHEDVYLNLWKCHLHLGLTHLAIADLQNALRLNPSLLEPRLSLADLLAEEGRIFEAIDVCRPVSRTGIGALAIAKFQVLAALGRSKNRTLIEEARRAIRTAAAFPMNKDESDFLLFRLLVSERELDEAARLLEQLSSRISDPSRLELAKIDLLSAAGDRNQALQRLDKLKSTQGQSALLISAYAKFYAEESDEKVRSDELVKLCVEARELSEPDRWTVLSELATRLDASGSVKAAGSVWKEIAERTDSTTAWRKAFEHALVQQADAAELDRMLQAIKVVEGGTGLQWHVCTALWEFTRLGKNPDLRISIRGHLREAVKQAGADSVLVSQVAELAQKAGLIDDAISYYRGALTDVPGHAPDLAVLKNLVDLLMLQRRHREAHQEINRFLQNKRYELPRSFKRQAAALSLLSNRRMETLSLARELFNEGSEDFSDQLWLGQLLAGAGDAEGAQKCFEKATQLAPEEYVAWAVYLRFLFNAKRYREIEAVFQQAVAAVPEKSSHRFLAEANEAVGNPAAALEHSSKAVEQDPDDLLLLLDHASLLSSTYQFARAEVVYRKVLASNPDESVRVSAEKSLALCLSNRGDYPAYNEALQLVSQARAASVSRGGIGFDEDLILAQIQGKSPFREGKLAAIAIFSGLQAKGFQIPDDSRMVWLQVYLDLQQWNDAYWTMSPILAASDPNPLYLTKCIYELLSHEEIGEGTQVWINRLKQVAPEAEATVQLESLHFVLSGDVSQAIRLVNDWAKSPATDEEIMQARKLAVPKVFAQLAAMARMHGRTVEATRIEEAAIAGFESNIAAGQVEQAADLAMLYADDVRTEDSLRVLDEFPSGFSVVDVGQTYLKIVKGGDRSVEIQKRLSVWIDSIDLSTADTRLVQLAANLAHASGNFDKAILLYQHVISQSPNELHALNELAFLMALTGRSGALPHINHAIEQFGPRGFLLDTRALILLNARQPEAALRDSQAAVADQSTAEHLFRQAQILVAAGQVDLARTAWREAISKGLRPNRVHPLELSEFQRIESLILGTPAASTAGPAS